MDTSQTEFLALRQIYLFFPMLHGAMNPISAITCHTHGLGSHLLLTYVLIRPSAIRKGHYAADLITFLIIIIISFPENSY